MSNPEKSPKKIRIELWEYLKEQGIEINAKQHDRIKEILEEYVAVKTGITPQMYKGLQTRYDKLRATAMKAGLKV